MDAASNIQKMWRGKEALERVERIRVEVWSSSFEQAPPAGNALARRTMITIGVKVEEKSQWSTEPH